MRKLEIVERLSDLEKDMVASVCRDVKVVGRRQDIISDGESPEHLHLLVDGWAARYKILKEGARRITAIMMPGDFCDLHATILCAMDHGIMAITDCKVAYVANEDIDRITRGSATLARAFWRATLVDEAILRQWLVNSGRRAAVDAIAHLLCELHLRAQLIGLESSDRFSLPLTQEDLADATGLTTVHVNRMVQELRKQGLIEMDRGDCSFLMSWPSAEPATSRTITFILKCRTIIPQIVRVTQHISGKVPKTCRGLTRGRCPAGGEEVSPASGAT